MSMVLFEPGTKLLPALCKPYPDELLSSWLMRLAHNHGLGLKELYNHIWPEYTLRLDIDKSITNEQISRLALITNCTDEDVLSATLLPYKSKLFPASQPNGSSLSWILPGKRRSPHDKRSYFSTGLMFCPRCLINDNGRPYFRKQWRLATSFVCSCCGCFLIEDCPHCHHGNSFLELKIGCFNEQPLTEAMLNCHTCGRNITDTTVIAAPWSARHLQRKLNVMIDNTDPEAAKDTEDYFNLLYNLSSAFLINNHTKEYQRRFAKCVLNMNGLEYNFIQPHKTPFVRHADLRVRTAIVGLAHWLLEGGPERLKEVCLNAKITVDNLQMLIPRAPQRYYEPLKKVLTEQGPWFVSTSPVNQGYNHVPRRWDSNIIPWVETASNLHYEIDINEKYYAYTDIEQNLYEDIQSECCSYHDDYDYDNDIVNELSLKPDSWLYA